MNRFFIVLLCSLCAIGVSVSDASGKGARSRYSDYRFTEMSEAPLSPAEIGGSMFQAAAATTVTLGWWQFDTAGGAPTKQGWSEVDITTQVKKYWHVDGNSGTGCNAFTPINGAHSMWCGQWATTTAPWCGWAALPGYGNNWDQSLGTTVSNVTTLTYTIAWDSEPGYDFTHVQWWDATNAIWVDDPAANGATGYFDGAGGPLTETLTSPYGATKVRFHQTSDGAWCDEDGLWDTVQGACTVDDLALNGGAAENWEGEACLATQSTDGVWVASVPPGFGLYSHLVSAATVVQEDPCAKPLSNMWAWFDNPAVTNYACGGWPLQGAVPYGPDANGLYMNNEIWSPVVPIAGLGDEYILSFLTYRDLPLSNLVFFVWHVRTQVGVAGCPSAWRDLGGLYYGYSDHKNWVRSAFQVGSLVSGADTHIQIALGAVDMCGSWCGTYGDGVCHSHAPLIDQVKLYHVATFGPQWTAHVDAEMWNDNFPESGGVGPTDFARCDMGKDILPRTSGKTLPGDSLKIAVADPNGLTADNTGGRPGNAVYVFVRCTDSAGVLRPYTGLQMQSPDNQAWAADPNAGLMRWPLVVDPTGVLPAGWYAYRLDKVYTKGGAVVKDTYCADLMDLAAGPDGPPYHPNESWAGNTGIFRPGDVIWYFFGAKNSLGQWSYYSRDFGGQGRWFRSNNMVNHSALGPNGVPTAACEWSVLPDKGRSPGSKLVIDKTNRSTKSADEQIKVRGAFSAFANVDFYDENGGDPLNGNSATSRVKNDDQVAGVGYTVEVLIGDDKNAVGNKIDKRNGDCRIFGKFVAKAEVGMTKGGVIMPDGSLEGSVDIDCQEVKARINFQVGGTRKGGKIELTFPFADFLRGSPGSSLLLPDESFYAFGGCPKLDDFDILIPAGEALVTYRFGDRITGPAAALAQETPTEAGGTARVFVTGFGFDSIRDDDVDGLSDYVAFLHEVLQFVGGAPIPDPIGIEPVVFENRLDNSYPNPFNPTTTIKYSIAEPGYVTLRIYNAAGQLIRTLVDEEQAPRPEGFSVNWDGTSSTGGNVASGVYFYQITAQNFSQTKKLVLLK